MLEPVTASLLYLGLERIEEVSRKGCKGAKRNPLDCNSYSDRLSGRWVAVRGFRHQPAGFMNSKRNRTRTWILVLLAGLTTVVCSDLLSSRDSQAQSPALVLFSHADSTRAIAVESVTNTREPFAAVAPIAFGNDARTRIMLFAGNLHLQDNETFSAVTADAEDEAHNILPLPVEYIGAVPDQSWATAVIVKLNDPFSDPGDVLVQIHHHGVSSNRVRVGIGHTGGGPPDDQGAVPTPGPLGSVPNSTTTTAGTLTTDEVKTIIAQAVSAASSINQKVTVAVTDRE